jgi:hypothetical protein
MENTFDPNWLDTPVPCKSCNTPTDALAIFPGGLCLTCHEARTYRGFTSADVLYAIKR